MMYGKLVDWSYFDHPPLVGWTQWLFQIFFSSSDLSARLPALLLSLVSSYLLYLFLKKRSFSESAALMGVLALNVTPLFNGISMMLLPDNFIFPLAMLALNAVEDIKIKNDSWSVWMTLGVCLGLSGLSKYSAIFMLPPIAIYLFSSVSFKSLIHWKSLLAVLIALLIVSPVLIWNVGNDFISFKYQTGHLLDFANIDVLFPLQSQVIQLVGWGVGLYFIGVLFFLNSAFRGSLPWLFAGSFLLFFLGVSLGQVLLPHWMVTVFSFSIPMMSAWIFDFGQRKLLSFLIGFSALLSLFLLVEMGFKVLPGEISAPAYYDILGWREDMKEASRLSGDSVDGIAVTNWSLGSRAFHYNSSAKPIWVLDQRFDQFDLWNPESPIGKNLLILIEAKKEDEILTRYQCEQVTKVLNRKTILKGALVRDTAYFQCKNFLSFL